MRWTLSCLAVLLLARVVWAAELKDPKSLDVPAEKMAAAKELIRKLDDDDILVRDKLTAELKAMGRFALPAMLDALKGKLPDRVALPLRSLLPVARQADFVARYPYFLADRDCKFEHDLPGWNDLKGAVKDTKESRLLFADILEDEECRDMLLLALDRTDEGRAKFEGRWKAKKDGWWVAFWAGRQPDGHAPKADAPIHWVVAALLSDLLYDRDYRSDARVPVLRSYAKTDEGKKAATGKGRHGDAVYRFARRWIERQADIYGLQDGGWLADEWGFDEPFKRRCLERQFEWAVARKLPTRALTSLAATRDPKYIPSFRELFTWEQALTTPQFATFVGAEIQMRDAALSMCIALSGQDPVEYGFSAQNPKAKATDDARFWTDNYFFKDTDGKTADDKRKAAFAKWAEWEKANPDKIKAKAPDKK